MCIRDRLYNNNNFKKKLKYIVFDMAISGSLSMEEVLQAIIGDVQGKQTEKVKENNIRTQIDLSLIHI